MKTLRSLNDIPFEYAVALGQHDGILSTDKYANSPSIDTVDSDTEIWTIKNWKE